MRFERTDPFKADYQGLSEDERQMFREAARAFNAGCDRFVETKDLSSWPAGLRVKPVVNAPGIFEMTWSFSGPDGRATWQWTTTVDDTGRQWPAVRWRRLGSHRIFREP
ncbi:MAG: hypothetical protein ACLPR9_15930 [Acidimicrobiales bacterium]